MEGFLLVPVVILIGCEEYLKCPRRLLSLHPHMQRAGSGKVNAEIIRRHDAVIVSAGYAGERSAGTAELTQTEALCPAVRAGFEVPGLYSLKSRVISAFNSVIRAQDFS